MSKTSLGSLAATLLLCATACSTRPLDGARDAGIAVAADLAATDLSIAPLTITRIDPVDGQLLGQPITITGTGFGADPAEVKVFIVSWGSTEGGTPAVVTKPFSPTTITATLPTELPGLTNLNTMGFQVRVEVGDQRLYAPSLYFITRVD